MAIRDTLARLFGAKASILGLPADEIPDRPLEKSYDDASLLSTFGDDAWPYIVGNKIGEQASQAPLQICTRKVVDNRVELTPVDPDHPVQQLFDVPHPQLDGGEFTHLLLLYMGLTGHAPIEVVHPTIGRRTMGRTRLGWEIWLHNPGPWRIVANPDGTIKGYLHLSATRGQEDIRWEPDQMTYLRWPNPSNRWYGQGHIQAARQAVMAEEYAAIRDKKFEKNYGVPPGILSSEMPLGDPTAELLQKRWSQAVGGYQNAGKIAILGSKTTFQPIELSRKDNEWLATRLNRVEIIAGAWGMPLPLIRMQDATFSNVAGARSELWEGTLQPRLNRIARMITLRVLPLITTERLVARYDYTQVEALSENDLEAAQTASEWAKTGAVIVDEVRTRLSLPPHPDVKIGKSQLVPTTIALSSFESITAPPEPPAPPATPPGPKPKAVKAEPSPRDVVLSPIRDEYARDLGQFFETQRNAVLNAFGKANPEEEAFLERLMVILGSKRFRDRLKRISEGPIGQSVTLGATEAARALSIEVSFAIPTNDAALARVTSHLETLGKGIENTTIADVRRVVTGQLQAGATHAETRAALSGLFDDYQTWRLDRIARTETAAAYNLGALGQYKAGGIELVTVVDGDADEICAAWNGREHVPLAVAEGAPLGHPNAVLGGSGFWTYGGLLEMKSARYDGPAVRLTFPSDRHVTIGPNHPVLTRRGMVAAGLLNERDEVVYDLRADIARSGAAGELNLEEMPAVENVFAALLPTSPYTIIATTRDDLHGDGVFCQGEVQVVWPERELLHVWDVGGLEEERELVLAGANAKTSAETGHGASLTSQQRVLLTATRGMRRPDIDSTHFLFLPVLAAEHVRYAGTAYDASTESSLYCSSGLVVSNCTRSWIPEVGDGREAAKALPAPLPPVTVRIVTATETPPPPEIIVEPTPVNVDMTPVVGAISAMQASFASESAKTRAAFNVEPPAAPIVNVDMAPVTSALKALRADIDAVKREVRKPRTRKLLRDEFGRPTGSQEVSDDGKDE